MGRHDMPLFGVKCFVGVSCLLCGTLVSTGRLVVSISRFCYVGSNSGVMWWDIKCWCGRMEVCQVKGNLLVY